MVNSIPFKFVFADDEEAQLFFSATQAEAFDVSASFLNVYLKESFGYSLILSGQVIPVAPDAKALLSRFTGKRTVADIEKEFGEPGVLFTKFLRDRGFLE